MTVFDIYVGTYTTQQAYLPGPPSPGIEHFLFDDRTGVLERLDTTVGVHDPQHLARHPTLPVIYAAEATNPGAVASFAISEVGVLTMTSRASSLGDRAVAVSVHPSGHRAYTANWIGGTITAFALAADGTLGVPEPIPQGEVDGRAVPIADQTKRPHHIRPTPNGQAVVIAYAGSDEVLAYDADTDGRVASLPVTRVPFPAQTASRHIEFHPSGDRVYAVGERDSQLHVLEADDEKPLRLIRSLPTTPPGEEPHF